MAHVPTERWRWMNAALAGVLLGAVGCGGGRFPVEGRVTFKDGKPLTGGKVIFEATGEGRNLSARGDIQADGTYRMGTESDNDGVPPGHYRVLVTPPLPKNLERRGKPPIDLRFSKFETSGLEFTVTTGPNRFPIEVERPQ